VSAVLLEAGGVDPSRIIRKQGRLVAPDVAGLHSRPSLGDRARALPNRATTVYPSVTGGNTSATTLMIGEHCAAMMRS
jgi:hypothetical protein